MPAPGVPAHSAQRGAGIIKQLAGLLCTGPVCTENNHIAHGGATNRGSREVLWGRETPEEEDEKVPFLKEDT